MSALHDNLHRLRSAFRAYAATQAPDIAAFTRLALAKSHEEIALPPRDRPATRHLAGLTDLACPATRSIVEAVIAAAPHLHWRRSYTTDDPGFDAHYLDNYAWFNLIAPSGPFVSEGLRLSVGYWGKGLHYPIHRHAPEEIYLTLAGEARYISEGRADVIGGPGATICHHSNQPHAAKMENNPLLAAAFWRGDNLEARPGLRG